MYLVMMFFPGLISYANKLKIENNTKYYLWMKNVEYGYLGWKKAYDPPKFQPVGPGQNKEEDIYNCFGYRGDPKSTGIKCYISRNNDEADAIKRGAFKFDLKTGQTGTLYTWAPFEQEDIAAKATTTPVLEILVTSPVAGLYCKDWYRVTITESPKKLFQSITPEEANMPERQKYFKYDDNLFIIKNTSKHSIGVGINKEKPVMIPGGESRNIDIKGEDIEFTINADDFKNDTVFKVNKKMKKADSFPISVISKSNPKNTYKGSMAIKPIFSYYEGKPEMSKVYYEADINLESIAPMPVLASAESITPKERGVVVDTSKINFTNNVLRFENKSAVPLEVMVNDKNAVALNAGEKKNIDISTKEESFQFSVKIPSYSTAAKTFTISKTITNVIKPQEELRREKTDSGYSDIIATVIPGYYKTENAILKRLAKDEKPYGVNFTVQIEVKNR